MEISTMNKCEVGNEDHIEGKDRNWDQEFQFWPWYCIITNTWGLPVSPWDLPHAHSSYMLGLPHSHIPPNSMAIWMGVAESVCILFISKINTLGFANLHTSNQSKGVSRNSLRGANHREEVLPTECEDPELSQLPLQGLLTLPSPNAPGSVWLRVWSLF